MEMQKPPAKRRKLTDKTIPNALLHSAEYSVDSQMYQDLVNMERKLDWTITRKRTEVQDALSRPMTVSFCNGIELFGTDERVDYTNATRVPQPYSVGTGLATSGRYGAPK